MRIKKYFRSQNRIGSNIITLYLSLSWVVRRCNTMKDNVDIIIGPGTEAIAGEGRIVTPGGIDAHIH